MNLLRYCDFVEVIKYNFLQRNRDSKKKYSKI